MVLCYVSVLLCYMYMTLGYSSIMLGPSIVLLSLHKVLLSRSSITSGQLDILTCRYVVFGPIVVLLTFTSISLGCFAEMDTHVVL